MPVWTSSRRGFVKTCITASGTLVLGRFVTACASTGLAATRRELITQSGPRIDLEIANTQVVVAGRATRATTINGGIPGPELRLQEGQDVHLAVHNALDVDSSIHWHGILIPPGMDGVPGISFPGIRPGETFNYRFVLRQAGTYWYHSHSGFQEQTGLYGPLIIEPKAGPAFEYDREYTIVLSDWTFEDPQRILANLKKYGGYYNFQRGTVANFPKQAREMGFGKAFKNRRRWGRMRMDSTDIADVTGVTYTYLINGLAPDDNWTGLFSEGERIRLRFINASAGTFFDVRTPGLPMTVVQADGMNVVPVETDEFRLAIAETMDVLVTPTQAAHTIFAEAMDRSGFARATLATQPGAVAPVPERRSRPLLTMMDMGMAHGAMTMKKPKSPSATSACAPLPAMERHDDNHHGAGNAMVAEVAKPRPRDPGVGLRDMPWRVLTYADLRNALPREPVRPADREIKLHLTGNMERYMWSIDGEQFRMDMPDIVLKYGERVRFVLINDTMMTHPMHLHGMFFELDVGACEKNPLKHTVSVKPAEYVSFIVTANEVGRWAFHCHILYHMEAGMFRVVRVEP